MRGAKALVAAGFLAAGLFAVLAGGQAETRAQGVKDTPAKAAPTGSHDKAFEDCAKVCGDCALECEKCGKHCGDLVAAGQKEHQTTVGTCCDCAAICLAAMKSSATKGPFAGIICDSCAKVCDGCAAACEKHAAHDPVMARCGKACRDCAKACRDMITHVGTK
jgi:hypothetical protein